ncbi:MAG: bifunctional UDP-sugar hydrolase/5'-nucleotidase [Salinivirgaceae bacterium]|jgi:2',3'-cyclic-nucleotide 2'-phosphodiesterase/3'-nucleotidase|nr:bifunctional UDP-sugar hydrolase/5'-nucleotidase [Salinivirgaceae bacterium]
MRLFALIVFISLLFLSCKNRIVDIHIIETTDLHGHFYNYDFSRDTARTGSLGQVAYFVDSLRKQNKSILLLDNGDILQGDPTVYYSNFVQKTGSHLVSRMLKDLGFEAATVGNHDIEAGSDVYSQFMHDELLPWLGANVVNKASGEPAFKPYVILEKQGVKIAIMGLTSPGVPTWLPEKLYRRLEFKDMVTTAKKFMPEVQDQNPDIVIGLFHAGLDPTYNGYSKNDELNPNATISIVEQVPGFDVVFAGHDHKAIVRKVPDKNGKTVLVVNGGSHGKSVGHVKIQFDKSKNQVVKKDAVIEDVRHLPVLDDFANKYSPYLDSVKEYFAQPVGQLATELCPQEALFGPSRFMQFIHDVQLTSTDADISFSAPLQINSCIPAGTITRSDVFSIYRFENYLATLNMTLVEVDAYLEYAVSQWFNTMTNDSDELLVYSDDQKLKNPYFNFSSAAGLKYVVDVSKPNGNKVEIVKDKKLFSTYNDTLRVTVNSYRLVGGGGHLPRGVSIDRVELKNRNVWVSDEPIKSLIIKYFEKHGEVSVKNAKNWTVLPELWKSKAVGREKQAFYR